MTRDAHKHRQRKKKRKRKRESRLPEAAAGHVGFLEGPDPGSHPGPDQTEHAPYLQKLVPV